ncbi:MAG: alpha-ketoglutarate-dependent dioxygenase AlkB [Oligoflexales bacterium]|nr:alpha-ketoglutarate-dependent dioxygenase AlkB [Oligoflexales bacterium]
MSEINELPSENVMFIKNWLGKEQADDIFAQLMALKWHDEYIKMFGKTVKVPRKVIWVGDEGASYTYSQVKHKPRPWPDCLNKLRSKIVESYGQTLNSALLNLYEDGKDYMGWHSDNEAELGIEPVIISISFGASRRFLIKSKSTGQKYEYLLEHGSLLVMRGSTQEKFRHSLPKMLRVNEPRINVTFRNILT